MNSVNCGVCGNTGRIWDDYAGAKGRDPHKHCHCIHGDRLAVAAAAAKRKEQEEFKTCPACDGKGKVKRDG